MMRNNLTCKEGISMIIDIINQDGEDKSDGQCIDEIWETLDANGYIPKEVHTPNKEGERYRSLDE